MTNSTSLTALGNKKLSTGNSIYTNKLAKGNLEITKYHFHSYLV